MCGRGATLVHTTRHETLASRLFRRRFYCVEVYDVFNRYRETTWPSAVNDSVFFFAHHRAQVEFARGVLRRLGGDLAENRELAVFNLEKAIGEYEASLKLMSSFLRCSDQGNF